MRILFQGDSITDADRIREDVHNLGNGYPKYAAQYLTSAFPDVRFEFINLGISGNETKDLLARLQSDFVDIGADIVSILIGVNDTWHHASDRSWIDNALFESNYRQVLSAVKQTGAKIMMIEPFLLHAPDKEFFYEDLDPKIKIERKLACEFADVYLPLDGLFASACTQIDDPLVFSEDGVHPNQKGSEFIGKLYCEYVSPLIEELK